MVPVYCLFRWLGWIGTLKPLWVGSFFAGAVDELAIYGRLLTPRQILRHYRAGLAALRAQG